ncbi:toxin-antitoxin system HicB family antitoxin [Heliobacillus mobilis]|uniref:Toxin-antitoxin system HicB family antitoxin n=1 Tax=Heliobacterium mobile TaxID=28064 RepID=A0A6I3SN23_HELMO|nr:toxin-antitoxin system HicB family antitoxin [Heliobacterium mobile]MTV50125.1 toxin-antitoxin system HicB family antitoxin [Heliobacterium mobile]
MPPKKSFPLRIDPNLYQALEKWAGDEMRSVNAHIEFLLREAVIKVGRLPKTDKKHLTEQNLSD